MDAGQRLYVLAVAAIRVAAQEIFSGIARAPDVARLDQRVDAGRGLLLGAERHVRWRRVRGTDRAGGGCAAAAGAATAAARRPAPPRPLAARRLLAVAAAAADTGSSGAAQPGGFAPSASAVTARTDDEASKQS